MKDFLLNIQTDRIDEKIINNRPWRIHWRVSKKEITGQI
jgi:hypothetical protein